jgi:hypothetical protein
MRLGGPPSKERIVSSNLSIRIDAGNLNHHLWNNHGTWWVHYTVHPTPHTKRRVRMSLRTRDVRRARKRRDVLLRRCGAAEEEASGAQPPGGASPAG